MANGHGGSRKGAGRKRKPAYKADGKETPLDFMLKVMRNASATPSARMEAAKAAAPFCHARLAQIDHQVDADVHIELVSYLDQDPDSQPAA